MWFKWSLLAGSLVAVTAVRGAIAKLPCEVSSVNPDDPVLLVLWYKNASLTPVYRYDPHPLQVPITPYSTHHPFKNNYPHSTGNLFPPYR